MTNVWMPSAYQALLTCAASGAYHGGTRLWLASKASAALHKLCGPVPNLLISESPHGSRRALWLLHKPECVLGLVVSPQTQGGSEEGALCGARAFNKSKVGRVVRHLDSLPFRVASSTPLRPPMVVHKNHLVGWRIDGEAAPLYAHTLDQLAKLKSTHLLTISPENAFICRTYYEWDSWKEVSMEPGWSWHHVNEDVASGILDGKLTFEELRTVVAEVS